MKSQKHCKSKEKEKEKGFMMNTTALRVVLFTSFVLVMLTSVTHVAWAFGAMEGTDSSLWSTLLSYGCAVAIDIAIAAISLFLTSSKKVTNKAVGYLFVSGLTAVSWFSNWLYNKAHMSMTGVWTGTVLSIHMQWLAPIIFGSLPLLVIAFSLMIDHFTGTTISAAELTTALEEKAALDAVRKKYQGKSLVRKLADTASEVRTVVTELAAVPERTELPAVPAVPSTEPLTFEGTDTEPSNVVQFSSSSTGSTGSSGSSGSSGSPGQTLRQQIESMILDNPGIKNYEIVAALGVAKSYVSTIRTELDTRTTRTIQKEGI